MSTIIDSSCGRRGCQEFYNKGSGLYLFWQTVGSKSLRAKLASRILGEGDVQQRRTNINASMTDWNISQDPVVSPLAELISKNVSSVSRHYFNRPEIAWDIHSMWGASYIFGDSARVHDHYPATWSAVYYVNVGDGSSNLVFPSPALSVRPWDGLLLIFPSNIGHEVPAYKGAKARVIVAANLYCIKLKQ